MNAQVSFGSQPQYRPHAASAQMAPQMIATVYSGKENATTRYAALSRVAAAGSLPDRPVQSRRATPQ